MRHRQSGRQLNRNSSHRKALFMNMSNSLIKHELIKTTVPKAKELRRTIEPLITLSKVDNVANRRRAFSKLRNKFSVGKLFSELGQRFSQRPGGYIRILKAGYRPGDNAPLAIIEFVDRLAILESKEKDTKKDKNKKEKDITPVASLEPQEKSKEIKSSSVKEKDEKKTKDLKKDEASKIDTKPVKKSAADNQAETKSATSEKKTSKNQSKDKKEDKSV